MSELSGPVDMWEEEERSRAEVFQRLAMAVTEFRVMRGWSPAELSSRAGVSETPIERVEAATARDIRIDTLVALANGFDVDIEVLLAPGEPNTH